MPRVIDFAELGGPVYVGRDNGLAARNKCRVDELDSVAEAVRVRIPNDAYSVNSSFFLGMFGRSLAQFGTREAFLDHYHLEAPSHVRQALEAAMERALASRGRLLLGR